MKAAIIFVSYEKVAIIHHSIPKKIPHREKCFNRNGKHILFFNDDSVVWKTSLVGVHSFCAGLQLFNRVDLPPCERKKLKGRMKISTLPFL